jgi:hypothetical protein
VYNEGILGKKEKTMRPLIFRSTSIVAIALLAAAVGIAISRLETPSAHAAQGVQLKDAPDFTAGAEWINTDNPIKLADLRGRIVLLDFWTLC